MLFAVRDPLTANSLTANSLPLPVARRRTGVAVAGVAIVAGFRQLDHAVAAHRGGTEYRVLDVEQAANAVGTRAERVDEGLRRAAVQGGERLRATARGEARHQLVMRRAPRVPCWAVMGRPAVSSRDVRLGACSASAAIRSMHWRRVRKTKCMVASAASAAASTQARCPAGSDPVKGPNTADSAAVSQP